MPEPTGPGTPTLVDASVPQPEGARRRSTRFGRFALLQRVGAGGMGEVYAAYDEQLDRKVALKVLHRSGSLSSRARTRLLREARALARLSHPNVVTVHDAGVEGDEVYLVMEFVHGSTLRHWLEQAPRSWGEILELFIAIGEGLAAVHELGLVHRDVKPDNVLVDRRGRPRLIDFGLVRARAFDGESERVTGDDAGVSRTSAPTRDDAEPDDAAEPDASQDGQTQADPDGPALAPDAPLTRTGATVGTPRYMAPEQFEKQPVTAHSDQFALCVTLYEALFGRSPFAGETAHARAVAVLAGEVAPPPSHVDVPAELVAVVTRGLRPNPEDRWPDMAALLAALRGLSAAYDPDLEDAAVLRRRRRTVGAMVGIAAVTLGVFGMIATLAELTLDAASVLGLDALLVTIIVGSAALLRKRWMVSRHTRRLVGFVLLMTAIYAVQDLTGFLVGRSLYHTTVANAVSFSILCVFAAPLTAGTLRWAALWAGVLTAMMLVDPPRFYLYFHLANLGGGMIGALLLPRRMVDRWIGTAAGSRGGTASPAPSGASRSSGASMSGGMRRSEARSVADRRADRASSP